MKRFLRNTLIAIGALSLGASGAYLTREVPTRYTRPVPRYHPPVFKVNHKAIENTKRYTVLITHEGFGPSGRGTGLLLDSTHVLTCAHLIPHSPDMDIWIYPYPGDRVIKAKVSAADPRKDLAIFELEKPVVLPVYARLAAAPSSDGEPLIIVGNALGSMKWYVTHGVLSGYQSIYALTDGLVQHGNSGGPWINNNGDVVAISDWSLEDKGVPSGVCGGVSAKAINEFLVQVKMQQMMMELMLKMLGGLK